MTSAMVALITWATRPEMVAAQFNRVAAPLEHHFAEKRAATWQTAKEQAWKEIMVPANSYARRLHQTRNFAPCARMLEPKAVAGKFI
jgi:hypothetical protein